MYLCFCCLFCVVRSAFWWAFGIPFVSSGQQCSTFKRWRNLLRPSENLVKFNFIPFHKVVASVNCKKRFQIFIGFGARELVWGCVRIGKVNSSYCNNYQQKHHPYKYSSEANCTIYKIKSKLLTNGPHWSHQFVAGVLGLLIAYYCSR